MRRDRVGLDSVFVCDLDGLLIDLRAPGAKTGDLAP
jgi:hypothetical protein